MISKFGIGLLASVAIFLMAPQNTWAATTPAQKNQIKQNLAKLNALPNKAAPYSKVNKYVTKLTKLDPKKANKYYKIGLRKLDVVPGVTQNASKLAKDVTKIVKTSGLPSSEVKKFVGQVDDSKTTYVDKSPYQASIDCVFSGVLA